jgi:hypothetical protein
MVLLAGYLQALCIIPVCIGESVSVLVSIRLERGGRGNIHVAHISSTEGEEMFQAMGILVWVVVIVAVVVESRYDRKIEY